jgi:subtilisin family serine protease
MTPFSVREKSLASVILALLCALAGGYLLSNSKEAELERPSRVSISARDFQPSFVRPRRVEAEYRPNQLIVQFKPSASPAQKAKINGLLGTIKSEFLKRYSNASRLSSSDVSGGGDIEVATLSPQRGNHLQFQSSPVTGSANPLVKAVSSDLDLTSQINKIKNNPAVSFVQPNYIYRLTTTNPPDDDLYQSGRLWNMYSNDQPHKTGPVANQYGSQADKAWDANHIGSSEAYVAVIDSGVDASHPDLVGNVDVNDAVDYVRDSKKVGDQPFVNKDEIGHGTHVAGIIGAAGNNKIGVVGVNWRVKIIPIKVVGAVGDETIDDAVAIRAFDYLTQLKAKGVNVVAANVSWGGYGIQDVDGNLVEDYALLKYVKNAARAGILCVASAGNDANDNDSHPYYPANFDTRDEHDGTNPMRYNAVIAVAAIDQDGMLWPYSNRGAHTVQLGAPGVAIISTMSAGSQLANGTTLIRSVDGSTYAVETGTSAAAPHVTGAIALYVGSHPRDSAQQIHDALLSQVAPTPSLAVTTMTHGRLDVSNF